MPQRFLKPGITTSKKWDSCSWVAQSFYIRLLTLVDDFGRYEADAALLRSMAFPLREDIRTSQVQKLMHELQANQLADFYTNLDGKVYIQLTNWTETPRSNRSRYPALDTTCKRLFDDENTPLQLPSDAPTLQADESSLQTDVSGLQANVTLPRHRQIVNESSIHLPQRPENGHCTEKDLLDFFESISAPKSDAEWLFLHWQENDWTVNGKPVRDWKLKVKAWYKTGRIFPSQQTKGNGKEKPEPRYFKAKPQPIPIECPSCKIPYSSNDFGEPVSKCSCFK